MARQWGFTGPYVFGTLSVVIMQLFLLGLTHFFTSHSLKTGVFPIAWESNLIFTCTLLKTSFLKDFNIWGWLTHELHKHNYPRSTYEMIPECTER